MIRWTQVGIAGRPAVKVELVRDGAVIARASMHDATRTPAVERLLLAELARHA